MMHVHPSAVGAVLAFLSVVVLGTAWRLAAMHLVGKNQPGSKAAKFGEAMAVQY
jgi:hypothetical protein